MIQRFLFDALTTGFQAVDDDPTLLEELFGDLYALSTTEIEGIKTVFQKTPVTVAHGYARTDHKFPLVTIILGNENESIHFIGDDAGMISEIEDPDFGADIESSIFQHTYQILCYSEHPDVTTYVYEVAKQSLIASSAQFKTQGLINIDLSGNELAPDPKYIPENLFVRQLTFRCQREFCVVVKDSKFQKAFRVGGMHVDNPSVPGDIVGVTASVKVVTGEGVDG